MRRSRRKMRRTRRQRGGDRTAEGLQKYLTDKLTPYTIEMAQLEGKRIIIKNNGTNVFLGYIVLPEGELGVDLDEKINGNDNSIKSHIEAWLKETKPIAE